MNRHVLPRPRDVKKSKTFLANPILSQHAADFAVIIDDIERGHDLTRYISRGIKNVVSSATKSLKERRDLDLMLNDWNVHHLHISTVLEPDGFVKRDGPLLFAVFQPRTAYLIDVMQHGDWTRKHVIRVVADEWPNEGIVHEIKGSGKLKVVGMTRDYTEEEHQKQREVGINVLMEIDGRVLRPGGGITTAGTTIKASRAADQLIIELETFETYARGNPDWMKATFARYGVPYPEKPTIEFRFLEEGGYGIFETVTGTLIPLG
jgi:hypothetical protein